MAQNSKGAYLNVLQDADGKDVYPITRADGVYMNDGTTAQAKCEALDSKINSTKSTLEQNFQAGVDGIYNAITAQGTTPASKSQGDVKNAIKTLADAKYAAGHQGNAGTGDVLSGKTFSNSSGVNLTGTMANQGSYTESKSWARGDGTTYIRIPKGAYLTATSTGYPEVTVADNLYGQGEYNNNYSSGYNNGVRDADNRANSSSTNYKSGYNAGYDAGRKTVKSGSKDYNYVSNGTYSFTVPGTVVSAGISKITHGYDGRWTWDGNNNWVSWSGNTVTFKLSVGVENASGVPNVTVSYAYY